MQPLFDSVMFLLKHQQNHSDPVHSAKAADHANALTSLASKLPEEFMTLGAEAETGAKIVNDAGETVRDLQELRRERDQK